MDYLVSIIVPVYNVEQYIDECIHSLLNQTYENLEIILVEDCSTDKSKDKCTEYTKMDSRIKLLEHEYNKGLEETRNDGVLAASGEYIMFLDSDDLYESSAVQDMVNIITNNNLDLVITPYIRWQDGNYILQGMSIENGVYDSKQIAESLFHKIPFPILSCVGSKIYSRKLLQNNGLKFDSHYKYNEDGAFIINALMVTSNIGIFNIPFYIYRIRKNGSIQSSYRKDVFENISMTDELIRNYLLTNDAYYGLSRKGFLHRKVLLIIDSLFGEIVFGNYKSFLEKYNVIMLSSDYAEIIDLNESNIKYRYVVGCLKYKIPIALYCSLKLLYLFKGDQRR